MFPRGFEVSPINADDRLRQGFVPEVHWCTVSASNGVARVPPTVPLIGRELDPFHRPLFHSSGGGGGG